MSAFAERVQAGCDFLDQHGPEGWRELIDAEVLDIRYSEFCVLGQLYGTYGDGCIALELDYYRCGQFGFDASEDDPLGFSPYGNLAAEWIRVLSQ